MEVTAHLNQRPASKKNGRGASIEYSQTNCECKTIPINFSQIQNSCRILSIEILPKFNSPPSIIFGYVKGTNSDDSSSFHLDRYQMSTIDQGQKVISHPCVLQFPPKFMKTITTKNLSTNEMETILLIGGGERLACFADRSERLIDATKSIEIYLPELKNLAGNVSSMDILLISDETQKMKQRLIICGHSNGFLNLTINDFQTGEIIHRSNEHDSFISSVRFFYHNYKPIEGEEPNLLVTSALEQAVVYRDVLSTHFLDPVVLATTDTRDCVTSSCIVDIDLDGKNEILLGTYGDTCFICRLPSVVEQQSPKGLSLISEESPLYRTLTLAASAYSLVCVDFTNDGLDEIIIATTKGLHIHQLGLDEVMYILNNRMEIKKQLSLTKTNEKNLSLIS
ncbi:unnamed protein product [Didymodactylos carnosus]|uniref:Kaptin n=1 Tax=Didymodactylos carnosus TaxID=1234261 RepID=A0A813T2H9_9BILA|nr:unnamed protein product [Didymodactylos carnosus]CAF0804389.1 unnamed protein product [Didymodactylos carnosus]CAF3556834.1 unnamed protein product [Didymodactylos carnosus]CAF3589608.1 unnamed protein product [Didymodactylos carnosus]